MKKLLTVLVLATAVLAAPLARAQEKPAPKKDQKTEAAAMKACAGCSKSGKKDSTACSCGCAKKHGGAKCDMKDGGKTQDEKKQSDKK